MVMKPGGGGERLKMQGRREKISDVVIGQDEKSGGRKRIEKHRNRQIMIEEEMCDQRWGMVRPVDQWVNPRLNWEGSRGSDMLWPLLHSTGGLTGAELSDVWTQHFTEH